MLAPVAFKRRRKKKKKKYKMKIIGLEPIT